MEKEKEKGLTILNKRLINLIIHINQTIVQTLDLPDLDLLEQELKVEAQKENKYEI
tara:strand:- start:114 stop:281 length:168 start_codon:yes stop_codon:yes gene_type:complete